MTAIDPVYARRLSRAIEESLTRVYGPDGYLRLVREAERSNATAPAEYRGSVVGGALETRGMGGNTHDAETARSAARR